MDNCKIIISRADEYDETLFHSDTFLGDEFSDEMYHWKYIKKKKVNGKWRYYYDIDDALGYDEQTEMIRNRELYKHAINDRNTRRIANEAYYEMLNKKVKKDPKTGKPIYTKEQQYRLKDKQAAMEYMNKYAYERGKKYLQSKKAYDKTVLGVIDNAKSKLNKGKKWLSKKLSIN